MSKEKNADEVIDGIADDLLGEYSTAPARKPVQTKTYGDPAYRRQHDSGMRNLYGFDDRDDDFDSQPDYGLHRRKTTTSWDDWNDQGKPRKAVGQPVSASRGYRKAKEPVFPVPQNIDRVTRIPIEAINWSLAPTHASTSNEEWSCIVGEMMDVIDAYMDSGCLVRGSMLGDSGFRRDVSRMLFENYYHDDDGRKRALEVSGVRK